MTLRVCANCGGGMEGKKLSAVACSPACNHRILAERRKAAKWEGVDPDRPCLACSKPLTGKRPHAQYCDRVCKAAGSSTRRETDGRGRLKSVGRRAATRRKISPREIERMLTRQRWICSYCPVDLHFGYHLDHVVPLSRGGQHTIGNIVAACPSCNCSKKDLLLVEWHRKRGR